MLSDKIFTEKEEFRLGYSENSDFLRLKTRVTEPIQILVPSTLRVVIATLVYPNLTEVTYFSDRF